MATRFSTEEVLAFITGDDNFGLSDSESGDDSNGDHPRLSWKLDSYCRGLYLLLEKLFLNKDQVPVMVWVFSGV